MYLEIGAPAVLPLGLAKVERDGVEKVCVLGLSVQHPPVNIFVQEERKRLDITGARADLGYATARRFFKTKKLKPRGLVEIERTIATLVGMGSDALNQLAMVQGLSWLNGLPYERTDAAILAQAAGLDKRHVLEYWAFARGGLLLVETDGPDGEMPPVVQRITIEHEREKDAWAIVLFFPRVPEGISETFEVDQYAAALQSAVHLSSDTGALVTSGLKTAVQVKDIVAFGQSLMLLQQMNSQALAKTRRLIELEEEDRNVIEAMKAAGAVAWGRSMTGLAIWGLVKGGEASRIMRKKVLNQVGYFGGIVLATVTENEGSRYKIDKDGDLYANKMSPVRMKPEKTSS